jgi:two-component system, LytTR family, response regulator
VRVLIVDDEAAARQRLAIMTDELDVEVVGEAENGLQALELARDRRPDVILLDISMPEVDGFDVARHLDEPRPLIVFQTAHDEFALRAFDHEAVDYLVKPVTLERLQRALDRVRERLADRSRPTLTADILRRMQETVAAHSPARQPRFLVRQRGGHRLIPYAEVLLFHARDGVVRVRTAEREFLTDYTLAELEDRTGDAFVRANRSELLNADHIESISSNGDGSATLTLSDGTEVRASRRRAAQVRAQLAQ